MAGRTSEPRRAPTRGRISANLTGFPCRAGTPPGSPAEAAGPVDDVAVAGRNTRAGQDAGTAEAGSVGLAQFPVPAEYPSTELLPMAARAVSRHAKTVFRRHVPPAPVPILKNPAFDLITRTALIVQMAAEPKRSSARREARRIGHFVRPLRSAVRSKSTTAPGLRPEHKVADVLRPYRSAGCARSRHGCPAGGPSGFRANRNIVNQWVWTRRLRTK